MKILIGFIGAVVILLIGVVIGTLYTSQNEQSESIEKSDDYQIPPATPTVADTQIPMTVEPTAMNENVGWKSYQDNLVSFQYPPSWELYSDGQMFENGDIIQVRIFGETQKQQTEFDDGAFVTFMNPLTTELSLDEYIIQTHEQSETMDPSTYKRDTVSLGSQTYERVYACGLGCSTHYYFEKNNVLYGIVTFSGGSKSDQYKDSIRKIIESATFH